MLNPALFTPDTLIKMWLDCRLSLTTPLSDCVSAERLIESEYYIQTGENIRDAIRRNKNA